MKSLSKKTRCLPTHSAVVVIPQEEKADQVEINPEKVATLNGKHTGWIESLFMNIEVHTATEEASILDKI